jgi:hypothetical protein
VHVAILPPPKGGPTRDLQSRRAAARFCCVSRPSLLKTCIHWPSFRLVRVSGEEHTTSARCHATPCSSVKASKVRIMELGMARSGHVASCRSKRKCWFDMPSPQAFPSLNPNLSLRSESVSRFRTSHQTCFSQACSVILPPPPSSASYPPCWSSRSVRSHNSVDSV